MNAVSDHYERLLAPIYVWMAGGAHNAFAQGAAELSALGIARGVGTPAIDLGCGFGMHTVPLARLGYSVTAIDSSATLLDEILVWGADLNICRVEADLCDFTTHVIDPPALILCMGDTLTHLTSIDDVENLCSRIAGSLASNGRFITTFRDYTRPARGDARFIAVRSDADRIHHCFLEEEAERIRVHDIVHERHAEAWTMRVSHYPKLRLSPDVVMSALEKHGLNALLAPGPRGMVQITAGRA